MAFLDNVLCGHGLFSGDYLTMRKDHQKFNKDIIIDIIFNNHVKNHGKY